ncbi:MAG TPA: LysM peptidoglycan-binding domain-containing protein [Flavobacteriaceae bacterium]|nr:LysM peptidoglycan-binding domain-containing protein [Flavobacteriaceae bacterium]MCB9213517.1 LysM peptidoglycan-binding domain-containing protein [Alteromonas sp.]HPF10743.1 LysM peptidoglycan-binding domain-containing protein [Flavobacteriaceae bacterium]HQU21549.1 LysM peptidoglycan-binding domain-containing protein [Flavobacteriaceae bacterium]HQU65518.1 LysM peptidoglycan-binding domain-containing protein [Flavobacteriaceae bacterium]
MSTGELKKLKVTGYKDDKFTQKVGDGEFTTLLNPEKYTLKYKVEYTEAQGQGTSATQPKFVRTPPEEFELDFLFDRTGVIKGQDESSGDGIIDDLEQFKKIVFDYSGDEHKPNYVMVGWGTLLFKGTLLEMSIEFKLFGPDGTPLRAVVKTKFKGSVEEDLRVAKENNNSPDLTHIRVVNEGDTLPLMTFKIYGDSKYYLEVAKANKLQNFRKLKVGQKIMFPPIEKVS